VFTKRIIPCLDVNDGRVVKGINFVNLRDAGDPVEIAAAYDKAGADIKEPGVFAKMAAKLQTAMKMAVNDDQSQAAKLLTEGCNMGIETISGSLNEYRDADSKSVAIAERLRTLEEKMVGDLQPLL